MSVKLVDYKHEVEENVQFGTCEICMGTGTLEYGVFIFEDEKGDQISIDNGSWSWGDWSDDYDIDNLPRFAEFFNSKGVRSLDDVEDRLPTIYYEYNE